MIPALTSGVLPEGVHSCSFEELAAIFGHIGSSDRRARLTGNLDRYLEEARRSGIAVAVVVDGSYVTSKDHPEDIDIVLALRNDLNLAEELRPMEYNVVSKRMARGSMASMYFPQSTGVRRTGNILRSFPRSVRPTLLKRERELEKAS